MKSTAPSNPTLFRIVLGLAGQRPLRHSGRLLSSHVTQFGVFHSGNERVAVVEFKDRDGNITHYLYVPRVLPWDDREWFSSLMAAERPSKAIMPSLVNFWHCKLTDFAGFADAGAQPKT